MRYPKRTVLAAALAVTVGGCASTPKKPASAVTPADAEPAKPVAKPILAVFDLEAKGAGISQDALGRLSDYLNVILVESGSFKVMPRQQVVGRLRSQKKASHKGCYDQQCQIDIGRELAASKTLAARVVRIGSGCTLTATLYDLKTATAENAARQQGACSEDDIAAMMTPVVSKLSGKEVAAAGGGGAEADVPAGFGAARAGHGRRGSRSVRIDCPDCVLQVDEEEEEARQRKQYKRDSKRAYRRAKSRYQRRMRKLRRKRSN